jgi:hypothetical protein
MHGTASDRHPHGANYKYPASKSHLLFNIDHFRSAQSTTFSGKKKAACAAFAFLDTCKSK